MDNRDQNDVIEDYLSSFTDMISPRVLPLKTNVAEIQACTAHLCIFNAGCVQNRYVKFFRLYLNSILGLELALPNSCLLD